MHDLARGEEFSGHPEEMRDVTGSSQHPRSLDLLGWNAASIPREGPIEPSYPISLNLNVLIHQVGLVSPSPGRW